MARVEFSDAWLDGSGGAVETTVTQLGDDAKFVLKPIDHKDWERWRKQFRVCEHCDGRKWVQVGRARAAKCPICRGETNSMVDESVRIAILKEIVSDWSGWKTQSGREIPFSEQTLELAAKTPASYAAIVEAATTIKQKIDEADEGN